MSQPVTSSRLNNSSVNLNGASAAVSTNFGLQRIGVTGNSFDISSSSGTVTLGITGTGNVQLGNATSGAVSFPGTTTFATLNSPAVGTNMSVGGNLTTGVLSLGSATSTTNLYGTLDVATIEGPTAGSAMTIGNNITAGSISIGNAGGANTVTIGNDGAGPTGTVNVGVSASTINIGTSQTAITSIGKNSGTVSIYGNVTLASNGGANLTVGNVVVGTTTIYSPNINIGATSGGIINIGHPTSVLTLNGSAITILGTTGSTMNVGVTGGALYLGDGSDSVYIGRASPTIVVGGGASSINIGNGGGYVGNVYIGSGGSGRGTIDIGATGSAAITLGSTTAPLTLRGSSTTFSSALTLGAAPTTSAMLGYTLNSSLTTGLSNTGPQTIYSPSSGTTAFQLPGGTYIAILQSIYAYSVIPNNTGIDMQVGIQYSASSVYSVAIGVVNIGSNISYQNLTQSQIVNVYPMTFVVPPGNTNYYFAYAYFGLGSLINGGTVTPSVKIISLIRIA